MLAPENDMSLAGLAYKGDIRTKKIPDHSEEAIDATASTALRLWCFISHQSIVGRTNQLTSKFTIV